MLELLRSAVESHQGQFHCVEIHREKNRKVVQFRHVGAPPDASLEVPYVPGLREFYATFEHLTLYLDERSGDAAYCIASPSQWAEMDGRFRPWIEGLGEDAAANLPLWIDDFIVVGEIPQSGNYLLVLLSGPEEGMVFEFEHDGFEFLMLGDTLPDFVMHTLDPDAHRLSAMSGHLRFITADEGGQWWIKELRDNRGNVVRTE